MSPIKMQKLESGIRLVAELIESVNSHRLDDVVKLLDEDCILEPYSSSASGELLVGRVMIRKHFEALFAERDNIHFSTEEILGFGHRCITRWKCTWRDETGMERSLRGVDIIREKNDRISEILSYCKTGKGN